MREIVRRSKKKNHTVRHLTLFFSAAYPLLKEKKNAHLKMPPPSPHTLRLINLADALRDEAAARLGRAADDALTDPPGEPHEW